MQDHKWTHIASSMPSSVVYLYKHTYTVHVEMEDIHSCIKIGTIYVCIHVYPDTKQGPLENP